MSYRLAEAARLDIRAIRRYGIERFGAAASGRYLELIDRAATAVAEEPMHPVTKDRSRYGAGFRSVHLRHFQKGRKSAVHELYYLVPTGSEPLAILRVLHERMDPDRQFEEGEEA